VCGGGEGEWQWSTGQCNYGDDAGSHIGGGRWEYSALSARRETLALTLRCPGPRLIRFATRGCAWRDCVENVHQLVWRSAGLRSTADPRIVIYGYLSGLSAPSRQGWLVALLP